MANNNVDLDKCFEVGKSVALEAGKIIREAFKKEKKFEQKFSAIDLVTETDKIVENLVISTIKKQFPTHSFIGEETSAASGVKNELTDNPTWIIDPIDGTTNFIHTFPFTCISIGFHVNKKAEIGIVFNPILDDMYIARAGQGAYLNDKRIHVSNCKELSSSVLLAEFGTNRDEAKLQKKFENVTRLVKLVHGVRTLGSAAMSMCLVAAGSVDGFCEQGMHCWDIAAGMLLVEEAGGVVMGPTGGPLDIMNRGVLCASSKELAEQIAKTVTPIEFERD